MAPLGCAMKRLFDKEKKIGKKKTKKIGKLPPAKLNGNLRRVIHFPTIPHYSYVGALFN